MLEQEKTKAMKRKATYFPYLSLALFSVSSNYVNHLEIGQIRAKIIKLLR